MCPRLAALALAACVLLRPAAPAGGAEGVAWHTDLGAARAEARREGKPLLVYVEDEP